MLLLVECHDWACTVKELGTGVLIVGFFAFFLWGLYKLTTYKE